MIKTPEDMIKIFGKTPLGDWSGGYYIVLRIFSGKEDQNIILKNCLKLLADKALKQQYLREVLIILYKLDLTSVKKELKEILSKDYDSDIKLQLLQSISDELDIELWNSIFYKLKDKRSISIKYFINYFWDKALKLIPLIDEFEYNELAFYIRLINHLDSLDFVNLQQKIIDLQELEVSSQVRKTISNVIEEIYDKYDFY